MFPTKDVTMPDTILTLLGAVLVVGSIFVIGRGWFRLASDPEYRQTTGKRILVRLGIGLAGLLILWLVTE
ncbi:MAG: hypothetical protein CMM74_11140 [Rhodospirillaceae bacterium]|nr:hypothetical protein [Rhodospirillaceae bacterium]